MSQEYNGFTIPAYTDAADAVVAFQNFTDDVKSGLAAKSDYAMPTNVQTGTTYTFTLADGQKLVTASNAAASTYTVPPQSSVAWVANSIIRITNLGAGTVTIAGGAGVTVTNATTTLAQYQSANLIRTASDAWTLVPFSGSSVLTSADVTGTTGSPTISTYGSYTVYKFTGATGSITLGKAGYCDVLLVGGGGGGGGTSGGGGGGGGVITGTYALQAGVNQVVVGAGGGAGSGGGSGAGGVGGTSFLGWLSAPGGNGGNGGNSYAATGMAYASSGGGSGIGAYITPVAVGMTGYVGGTGTTSNAQAAGGGGAGATGSGGGAHDGGVGVSNLLSTGSAVYYAGGGGGGGLSGTSAGGNGGGGAGGIGNNATAGTAGTANTGGGGGGGAYINGPGAAGGTGIVIIRVRT